MLNNLYFLWKTAGAVTSQLRSFTCQSPKGAGVALHGLCSFSSLFAQGGRGRWLAGSFLVLCPCHERVGMGDKWQPLHMTKYFTSKAQRSLNFTSLMITAFPISDNGQSTHPLFFFSPSTGWPCRPASLELGMTGSLVESSAPSSVLFPDHSRGPVVVPVGIRTGDSRIRVSLSNQGGPIKVPGSVNPANRMKIPNQCPQ
jgi:hypothetical protein